MNNKANQQIGKHKTTTSSQSNNSIPHASNSKYDDATSNKNPNGNFTIVTKQDNFFCKTSSDRLKIQTSNPESYRALSHFLKEQEAKFHNYQLKQDRPLRVVIRNLHLTTNVDTIKEELEVRLFEIRCVTNVLHKVTKIPFPLFFVDIEPSIKSAEIFHLSSLLHTKIKVEEPYKSKTISQCTNCQEYGHTKIYCGYPSRCVHCGSKHKSPDCPNQCSDPPKCALCSGDHPASYKGCFIYKDLQRVKKSCTKSNLVPTNTRFNTTTVRDSHPINDTHPIQPDPHSPTYAQATSGSHFSQPSKTPAIRVHIREIIVEKCRSRALYQRTRLPSHKQKYNKLANHLKKLLAKLKTKSLKSFLTNLSNDGRLWKATKNACKTKAPNVPIKNNDGSFAISDADKVELFKLHLFEIFQPHPDIASSDNINSVEEFLNSPLPVAHPVKHFTPNEVKYAIDKYPLKSFQGLIILLLKLPGLQPWLMG
ncbi:hypothetical protein QTP88_006048 [Uroleucon formosanum]